MENFGNNPFKQETKFWDRSPFNEKSWNIYFFNGIVVEIILFSGKKCLGRFCFKGNSWGH